jgi:AcrR family transcriptional regulator
MPRPSRNIDQSLLRSGRALFAELGCTGLSVRAVAEHAGVNVGMFHYHFASKDEFLRSLLQGIYDEMFGRLSGAATQAGAPLERLRQVLMLFAGFVRDHGAVVGRIWSDAGAGVPVAREFVQANAPRHVGLLLGLLDDAERAGALQPMPPLLRTSFLLGAVLAPLLVVPRVVAWDAAPAQIARHAKDQVLSDAAIGARIDLALAALRAAPQERPRARSRRAA